MKLGTVCYVASCQRAGTSWGARMSGWVDEKKTSVEWGGKRSARGGEGRVKCELKGTLRKATVPNPKSSRRRR